jgi:hypothetical protein
MMMHGLANPKIWGNYVLLSTDKIELVHVRTARDPFGRENVTPS